MARADVEKLLEEIYGCVPRPTGKEAFYFEEMVDSGTYSVEQTRRDILRLAEVSINTGDVGAQKVALEKWNRAFPENHYHGVEMLVGVENEP